MSATWSFLFTFCYISINSQKFPELSREPLNLKHMFPKPCTYNVNVPFQCSLRIHPAPCIIIIFEPLLFENFAIVVYRHRVETRRRRKLMCMSCSFFRHKGEKEGILQMLYFNQAKVGSLSSASVTHTSLSPKVKTVRE